MRFTSCSGANANSAACRLKYSETLHPYALCPIRQGSRALDTDDDSMATAKAHIAWLETASPDDWHRSVLAFQWSERFDPLMWIVQQEECDKATALQVFWAMSPEIADADEVRARRSEGWLSDNEIAEYIAGRLHGRGYRRARIAFDAEPLMQADYEHFRRAIADQPNPLWRPHPDMVTSIRGREIMLDDAFDDRCPEPFAPVRVDLPPLEDLLPYMDRMRSEIDTILLNIVATGGALGAAIFGDLPVLALLVFAGLVLYQLNQVREAAALVRGQLRADHVVPPARESIAIAAAGIAAGMGAALVLFGPQGTGWTTALTSWGARIGAGLGVMVLFWVVARAWAKNLLLRAYNGA